MQLTTGFSADQYQKALESWGWLELANQQPVLSSLFGDVFFRGDGGFWFLDTVEGTLTHRWSGGEALQAELNTAEGQDQYLLAGLAIVAHDSGLRLGAGEIYAFSQPPVLGGAFEVENLTTMDFVVAVNLAGQPLNQVHNLPSGTQISGFEVID